MFILKNLTTILLWLSITALMGSTTAIAEYTKADCLALVKVKSWKGTYTITGSNVGSGSDDFFGYQWNYQSSWTGQVTVQNFMAQNGPVVCSAAYAPGATPYLKEWTSPSEITTSTATVSGTEIITNTCSSGKTTTYEFPAVTGQPKETQTPFVSMLSLSEGTYTLGYTQDSYGGINPGVLSVNIKDSSCMPGGSVQNYDQTMGLGPYPDNTPVIETLPGANSPSMALKGSRTYQSRGPWGIHSIIDDNLATWTETWDLQPVTSDTPDKKEVEDPCLASGSIIGCENQSLGEAISLAGTPYRLHYQSNRTAGTTGANELAVAYAKDLGGWTLNVQHRYDATKNILYLGTGGFRSASSLGAVSASATSGFLIASEEGQLVYEFDANGRHTKTLNALTGATLLDFSYHPIGGWLIKVTDGDHNVTTFTRNTLGKLTSIVGPFGQLSKITLNKPGLITALQDPAGQVIKAKYAVNGLMSSFTNARGMTSSFTYDASGLLLQDKDPLGGKQVLARSSDGNTVTRTSATGRSTSYTTTVQTDGSIDRTVTAPTGLKHILNKSPQLAMSVTTRNGLQVAMTPSDDTRFGSSASLPQTYTLTTPGGIRQSNAAARVATLADTSDPFSLTQQTDTFQINGHSFSSSFNAASNSFTETSASGRQTIFKVDNLGRIVEQLISGLAAINYSYNSHGQLMGITEGAGNDQRAVQLAYNPQGYVQSITDANHTQSFKRDKVGRVLQQTLADGNNIKYAYDAGGSLLKLTNPAGKTYNFSYTKIGLLSSMILPAAKGAKTKQAYTYNRDGQLISKTRLDGAKLVYSYDSAGRLSSLTSSLSTWNYGYDPTYGALSSIAGPSGVNLGLTHDGPLLTAMTWSGPVSGQVGFSYNNDFQVQTVSVNNANPITLGYDNDGLLTSAGALSLQRNSQTGLITGATLGAIQENYTTNDFGEVTHYQASFNSTPLMSVDYQFDKRGRITTQTEIVASDAAKTYSYSYDLADRLQQVLIDNSNTTVNYGYDKNGNRLSYTPSNGSTATGKYDAQDRLLSYGPIVYGYNANGEVNSRTDGSETTKLEYDRLGNLTAVILANKRIDYLIDGSGMRVGKKIDGVLQQAFLYQDSLKPVAELDGAGNIVSRFVYATHVNVPDYMIRDGISYRILTDHLGSPRLVVNVADGSVAQRIDYDEFGNVLQDTQPGFQPFGFAGGLYDTDTNLVHYGAREFDPMTGRWTSRDPILFESGDTNLYGYINNDPVNFIDYDGLEGVHVGGTLYIKSKDTRLLKEANVSSERAKQFLEPGDKVTWLGPVPSTPFEKIGIIRKGANGLTCEAFEGYVLKQNLSTKPPSTEIDIKGTPMSTQAFPSYGVGTKG